MSLTVVTGWSPEGFVTYGRRFLEGFYRFMPADIELVVYGERACELPRGEFRLLSEIPGYPEVVKRHEHDPEVCGLAPRPHWKPRAIAAGYNWKYDARKFCRQGFIPAHAAASCSSEFLAWFDGDVEFRAPAPASSSLCALLPSDRAIAYLGRDPKWPEIGFQLYRLPRALDFLDEFAWYYSSDAFLELKEWHSAYVFGSVLRGFAAIAHDLTPGRTGDVWPHTLLGRFSAHLKGNRKYK